ncbi:hypothetical protein G6F59_016096 [Rhizopus arrhizus]|nr:hypothetical protein G6F23_016070 [Rhizopus arrhizus]KAG1388118.1 hypothetical protein G6F59_016096 [Rhizopus arrhizus]
MACTCGGTRHRVGGDAPARPVWAWTQCAAAAGARTCPPCGATWPGVQPAARAGPGGGDHRCDATAHAPRHVPAGR